MCKKAKPELALDRIYTQYCVNTATKPQLYRKLSIFTLVYPSSCICHGKIHLCANFHNWVTIWSPFPDTSCTMRETAFLISEQDCGFFLFSPEISRFFVKTKKNRWVPDRLWPPIVRRRSMTKKMVPMILKTAILLPQAMVLYSPLT